MTKPSTVIISTCIYQHAFSSCSQAYISYVCASRMTVLGQFVFFRFVHQHTHFARLWQHLISLHIDKFSKYREFSKLQLLIFWLCLRFRERPHWDMTARFYGNHQVSRRISVLGARIAGDLGPFRENGKSGQMESPSQIVHVCLQAALSMHS